MLPKSKRLKQEDFKGVRPKVFFRGDLLEAAYIPSSLQKFACVITKKRVKTAVARNTLKRKVFAAVRSLTTNQSINKTGFMVFYLKAISQDTPYQKIEEEIRKAFATLH